MKIMFLRHGLTNGNLEKRYIGTTDEPLCNCGIMQLKDKRFPHSDVLISSSALRCIQTAETLFPAQEIIIEKDFRECDFGDFEGKNYMELSNDTYYQKWIDSGGNLPFPNGESPADFRKRCISAFERTISKYKFSSSAAFIVHGGTIMAVCSSFTDGEYFDFQIGNGEGYRCKVTVGQSSGEIYMDKLCKLVM